MKKNMIIFAVILVISMIFTVSLSSCRENKIDETSSVDNNQSVIIKDVHVTEQPLSKIDVNEDSKWANNLRDTVSEPWIDENGDMCFGSANELLYYDVDKNEIINMGIPSWGYINIAAFRNGIIYGIKDNYEDFTQKYFIVKYENGKMEKILDSPIQGCYFAEEGIYYQVGNQICLMDYDGENKKLIVEIPNELYYEESYSKFIIYMGKLWYCYEDSEEYNYPMWFYDFDGTFTTFDKGDFKAANNGFFYYLKMDSEYHYNLYRFNCETYTVELVSDADIMGYSFYDGYILYSTYSDLYKMNSEVNSKILTVDKLGKSDSFTTELKGINGRLFVTGVLGFDNYCLAEIDINGNIISIIHEDEDM